MKDQLIVLMDADDTLLDFKKCERHAIEEIADMLSIERKKEFCDSYHIVNDNIWKEFEKGLVTIDEIAYKRFDRIFDMFGIRDVDSHEIGKIYKDCLSKHAILFDGARECLQRISQKYRLFVITNGITYTQKHRFEKAKLNQYFEKIFVSEQIGFRKPQKEFFDYVRVNIDGYEDSKAVVVGDSMTSDIQGGRNAGITTIWFNLLGRENKQNYTATYEVKNFDELETLLDTLQKKA